MVVFNGTLLFFNHSDFNAKIEIKLAIAALQSVGKRSLSGVSSCMLEASTAAGGAAQSRGGLFRTLYSHLLFALYD